MELSEDENDTTVNIKTKNDGQEELPKTAINVSLKGKKNKTKNINKGLKSTKVVEIVESDQEMEAN